MDKNQIQAEALTAIRSKKRCGLGISVGMGKTLIAIKHMQELFNKGKTNFLVVAPKKTIFDTWDEELTKHGFKHLKDKITFSTYLSMSNYPGDLFDAVYLDECHSLLYSHAEWLNTVTGIILGLTGTPPRNATSEKGEMVRDFCPIIYTYVTDDAIDDGNLNNYTIIVHELELDINKNYPISLKKTKFMSSEQANYNYWSSRIFNASTPKMKEISRIMRMKAMMEYPSKEHYAKWLLTKIKGKCLLFCNTQRQADKLSEHSYHSKNTNSAENLIAFQTGEIEQMSCVLSLSEGINIPNLKNCVIIHAYGNERKSPQRIGRLFRLKPEEKATIHILMYLNTVDTTWVGDALQGYDDTKIIYYNAKHHN